MAVRGDAHDSKLKRMPLQLPKALTRIEVPEANVFVVVHGNRPPTVRGEGYREHLVRVPLQHPQALRPCGQGTSGFFQRTGHFRILLRRTGCLREQIDSQLDVPSLQVHQPQQVLVAPILFMRSTDLLQFGDEPIIGHTPRPPQEQPKVISGLQLVRVCFQGFPEKPLGLLRPAQVQQGNRLVVQSFGHQLGRFRFLTRIRLL